MSNIVVVELQAIAGGLQLAKRTLDDVLARVTRDPGPANDPAALLALTNIIATSQAATAVAQQIQVLANPTGGGGVVGAGG
jgi:hypothetical protein